MEIFYQAVLLRICLDEFHGKKIGFVPTMGALHAGHISLIKLSKLHCDVTVCSIFVNPTQFNNPDDLKKYPRNEDVDVALLEAAGCDIVYLPEVNDIYPNGINDTSTASNKFDAESLSKLSAGLVEYDLSPLDTMLEGASRPGHFKGVANVVKRLLDIVKPDILFLGQKDYQQVAILKRLIGLVEMKVKIITGDILRESNGLAMSSRNARLDSTHRNEAGKIYQALQHIQSNFKKISWQQARSEAIDIINKIPDSKLDYVELRDANTLERVDDWNNSYQVVCLIAVIVDGVRLIDNIVLTADYTD